MPAESKAQQRFMGACMHGAGYANCPKMTQAQFREFASTKHAGLPERVKKAKGGVAGEKNYQRGTASATLGKLSPLPKSIYGSDIIPAALTPKEMVLTEPQQKEVMPIPGKKKHLLPSQIKKLHAMRPVNLPKMKMPKVPRIKFRFGAAEAGGERGPGFIPRAAINFQEAVGPGDLRGPDSDNFNPDPFGDSGGRPSTVAEGKFEGLDPRAANWAWQTFGSNPWLWSNFGGFTPTFMPPPWTQGFNQGPTLNPSFFDPQGFPYAQPNTADANLLGGSRHMGMRKNK